MDKHISIKGSNQKDIKIKLYIYAGTNKTKIYEAKMEITKKRNRQTQTCNWRFEPDRKKISKDIKDLTGIIN